MLIVEIGDAALVKSAYPDNTVFFSTSAVREPPDPGRNRRMLSAATLPLLWRTLANPDLTLLVVHTRRHAPWHPRTIVRSLGNRRAVSGDLALLRNFGPYLIRRSRAPLAVVDMDDPPLIATHNFGLWDRATLFFKRELPSDRWRVVMTTGHFDLPTPRMRELPRWRARIDKLRPISLGLPLDSTPDLASIGPTQEKTSDVFYSGRVAGSSTARERGWHELKALMTNGVRVDVPGQRLLRSHFYARISRAWLTWSPEGLGYECFRHYEAAVCGSVPVIGWPAIERYAPLLAGRHAIYHDIEPGGLTQAIREALAAPDRLRDMAVAAAEHVRKHHTPQALGRYVVETTLAAASESDRMTRP